MNVYIYSGHEVHALSLSRTSSLLRSLLLPNYAIQHITAQSLSSQPWHEQCALLVFPACRERPSFPSPTVSRITKFVEGGGAFLALRASARITKASSLGSLSLYGEGIDYTLRFQDKTSRKSIYYDVYPGEYQDDVTAKLSTTTGEIEVASGCSSQPSFHLNDHPEATVLAKYSDGTPAGSHIKVSSGNIVVWGASLEIPSPQASQSPSSSENDQSLDQARKSLVQESLRDLGLKLPADDTQSTPVHLLPQFLTSAPSGPKLVGQIMSALSVKSGDTLQGGQDTFSFLDTKEGEEALKAARSQSPPSTEAKQVIVCPDGQLPPSSQTPLFDIGKYYEYLATARQQGTPASSLSDPWGMGEALLYGEVITSTQSMLDKNHRLMSSLPSPLLSLASHQLSGRGRSGNTWVSPSGCLQCSLLLRVPLSTLPAHRLLFVQYLVGLAIAEACRSEEVLGKEMGKRVRVKWPNDIYVVGDGEGNEGKEGMKKVGGILVHSSFIGREVTMVIGFGLNVLNDPPIASLAQLIPPGSDRKLSLERTAAAIMSTFEPMWNTFLSEKGSFMPFLDLYHERWLHSDQLVTITTTTPHRQVRIVGITPDHGLLRTMPERSSSSTFSSYGGGSGGGGFLSEPAYIDLQPDGNSFDLMSGLIMTKQK